MVPRNGTNYFLYPDSKGNVLYVGQQAQYQEYQNLRAKAKMQQEQSGQAALMSTYNFDDYGIWGMRAQWHRNTGASLPTPPIEARNVISCDTTLSLCILPRRLCCLPLLILVAWARADNAPAFPEPYDTDPPDHVPISAAAAAVSFVSRKDSRSPFSLAGARRPITISLTTDPGTALGRGELHVRGRQGGIRHQSFGPHPDLRRHQPRRSLRPTDCVLGPGGNWSPVRNPAGGVYVMAPPRLLFLPDRNGDDIPDGEPEVLLDGFNTTTGSRHTFANGLKWGPDGWLWGRVGISSTARAGRPGRRIPSAS